MGGVTTETQVSSADFHGNALFAMGGVQPWSGEQGLLLADNDTDLIQQRCDGAEPQPLPDGAATAALCPTSEQGVFEEIYFTIFLSEVAAFD